MDAENKIHQRCLNAIKGKSVDRSPTYIPSIACSVAGQILGRPAYTGTGSLHYAEVLAWSKGENAHQEFEERFMRDIVEIHRILEIDVFRMPWRMNEKPTQQIDEFTFIFGDPKGDHSVWKYNPDSADFGEVHAVRKSLLEEEDLSSHIQRLETELDSKLKNALGIEKEHLELVEKLGGDFFVVYSGGNISVGIGEEDMMNLVLHPEWIARKLLVQAKYGIRLGESLVENKVPAVMLGGEDLASNKGPMYSVKSFQQIVLPAYQVLLKRLNALDVHYAFRSDGDLWPIMDLLFGKAECPGYGETDRDAGMHMGKIRERFPKLVVWGNFSSSFLQRASPKEIIEESHRIIEEAGGSGYFHGCSNAIIRGTPVENVRALFSVR